MSRAERVYPPTSDSEKHNFYGRGRQELQSDYIASSGRYSMIISGVTVDPATLNLLRKVWAMRGSAYPGERANAQAAAVRIVGPFGYSVTDIPHLLAKDDSSGVTPGKDHAAHKSNTSPRPHEHNANHANWRAEAEEQRRQKDGPEREEVLRRYGGFESVQAWTEHEKRLRAAVNQWSVFERPPYQRWTASIDGCSSAFGTPFASPRVVQALSTAYALPTTITAAEAEYTFWRRRDRDLGLAYEDTTDTHLDLPCEIRYQIVARLLDTGLHANSISELIMRQKRAIEWDEPRLDVGKAILRDLMRLGALAS